MIFGILRVVFFELEAHLFLIHHFSLELFAEFLLRVQVLLKHFFVVSLLL